MNDYHQTSKKLGRSRSALPGLQYWTTSFTKRLFPVLLKMHRGGRSQIRLGGSTQRGLRSSHGGEVTGQEDHEDGLLLAHDATRCSKVYEEVWQLPEIWERSVSSRRKDDGHFLTLAVCTMGNWHYGSPATRKETDEIPICHNWLFHKMDGSGSSCNNHRNKGTKFCMEKNCLQVWDSKDNNFRQWTSFWQSGIQVILLELRHQKQVLITRIPSGQRTDRSN